MIFIAAMIRMTSRSTHHCVPLTQTETSSSAVAQLSSCFTAHSKPLDGDGYGDYNDDEDDFDLDGLVRGVKILFQIIWKTENTQIFKI